MKSHLKRHKAPKSWQIKRKEKTFIIRPKPGAYPFKLGVPLTVVLRDMLGYAKTKREVRNILLNQEVKVDGVKRKELKFLVGLMSVVSIPKLKQNFRVLLNKKGKLELVEIKGEESNLKLCKIIRKTVTKKGMQLGLFDGRNILIEKDEFKVGDSVVIELPKQTIKKHLKFERGSLVYLTSGKHIGEIATIEAIKGDRVLCKSRAGEKFETKKEQIFVIGKDEPVIKVEK